MSTVVDINSGRPEDRPALAKIVAGLSALDDLRDVLTAGHFAGIDQPIKFQDDQWDLRGADGVPRRSKASLLSFDPVPNRFRDLVKVWTLAQARPDLLGSWPEHVHDGFVEVWRSAHQDPAKPSTLHTNLKGLRAALQNMAKANLLHVPDEGWDAVTHAIQTRRHDPDAQTGINSSRVKNSTLALRMNQIHSLDQLGHALHIPAVFGSSPWPDQPVAKIAPRRDAEAKLPLNSVRPSELVGDVLGYSLFLIDRIGPDVVAHLRWWRDRPRFDAADLEDPETVEDLKGAITDLMREVAAASAGRISGTEVRGRVAPAYASFARAVGLNDSDLATQWGRGALSMAERADGITYEPDVTVPICPLPISTFTTVDGSDEVAWADALYPTRTSLHRWAHRVVYGCAFYLNATIGVRDGDRELFVTGCTSTEVVESEDGDPVEVHRIHGYRQKQRKNIRQADWIVSPRHLRVVRLLEDLQELLGLDPMPHPDPRVKGNVLFHPGLLAMTGQREDGRVGVFLDGQVLDNVVKPGMAELAARGIANNDGSHLPKSIGDRVVRITCLQGHAARPLGVALVARIAQWDPGSARVMAGYVGDVLNEISLAEDEELEEIEAFTRGYALGQLEEELTAGDGSSTQFNDPARTAAQIGGVQRLIPQNPAMMSRNDLIRLGRRSLNVHIAPFTTCLYRPEGALCGGRGAPDFRFCLPASCRNSQPSQGQRAAREIRRRRELELAQQLGIDALERDAQKILTDALDLDREFAEMSIDDLRQLMLDETEDWLTGYLEAWAR